MSSRFKSVDDAVYRVIGLYYKDEADAREAKGLPRYAVLSGPFTRRSVARGQRTAAENAQSWDLSHYQIERRYEKIEVQECLPVWNTIPN